MRPKLFSTSNPMKDIINYYQVNENIFTGGQPTPRQFETFKENNIRLVINLALPDSNNAIKNEGEIVTALEMTYVHIPVDFKNPAKEDLQRFCKAMEISLQNKVFVHCVMNYRVSAFVFLYRVNVLKENEEAARKDMLKVWTPDPIWEMFIDENII
jgi:protein tyrosine phosphatase (PTP) superfamily phosphohydrolase (DUF442 family)